MQVGFHSIMPKDVVVVDDYGHASIYVGQDKHDKPVWEIVLFSDEPLEVPDGCLLLVYTQPQYKRSEHFDPKWIKERGGRVHHVTIYDSCSEPNAGDRMVPGLYQSEDGRITGRVRLQHDLDVRAPTLADAVKMYYGILSGRFKPHEKHGISRRAYLRKERQDVERRLRLAEIELELAKLTERPHVGSHEDDLTA